MVSSVAERKVGNHKFVACIVGRLKATLVGTLMKMDNFRGCNKIGRRLMTVIRNYCVRTMLVEMKLEYHTLAPMTNLIHNWGTMSERLTCKQAGILNDDRNSMNCNQDIHNSAFVHN